MSKIDSREVFIPSRSRVGLTPQRIAWFAEATGFKYFVHDGGVFKVIAVEDDNLAGDELGFVRMGEMSEVLEGPVVDRSTTPKDTPPADPLAVITGDSDRPTIVVVDGFFSDPEAARRHALASDLAEHPERHKGLRSSDTQIHPDARRLIESVTGPMGHGHSAFQLNLAGEQLVFHSDTQRWAAVAYLTPNAPTGAGTSFYRSRSTRVRSAAELNRLAGKDGWPSASELESLTYGGALLDRTRWEEVDRVGNVFNRFVLWDARLVHGVSDMFGDTPKTGRLCQLFFWD